LKRIHNRSHHLNSLLFLHTDGEGISASGTVFLRDLRKLCKTDPVWKFIQNGNVNDPTVIPYQGNAICEVHQGIFNAWYGNPRTEQILDYVRGTYRSYLPKLDLLINGGARLSQQFSRLNNTHQTSDNCHALYWDSYSKNLASLAMTDSVKMRVRFNDRFRDVNLLDLVSFTTETSNSDEAEVLSGNYIVTKVARALSAKRLTTSVEMVREQLGGQIAA